MTHTDKNSNTQHTHVGLKPFQRLVKSYTVILAQKIITRVEHGVFATIVLHTVPCSLYFSEQSVAI